ncbi:hypothetical protein PEPS_32050 (plasmid) [Persicobacter psychrovividus]|uniref:Sulfatase-modifying factor enzyme-like domain-containing protein n=1 Tax=Persicobacter psychrovividus TaxID=387638 RepID=A0ABM7VIW9_9BACT|nr:hypothetical protein PEPS_32050 [Persicobacter psychrovividus]
MSLLACTEKKEQKSAGTTTEQAPPAVPATKPQVAAKAPELNKVMVTFQGGTYMMGSDQFAPIEGPAHQVTVKAFKMDRDLTTVDDFRKFVQATGYQTDADKFGNSMVFNFSTGQWALVDGANWEYPMGRMNKAAQGDMPVTQVSWKDATAFAQWAGKRLPTEEEWEYAVRNSGKSDAIYPWGNEEQQKGKYMANTFQGELTKPNPMDGYLFTSPVGTFGLAPCGLTDAVGNVWQVMQNDIYPFDGKGFRQQLSGNKVIRGGSFMADEAREKGHTVFTRRTKVAEDATFNQGFRCAQDID